MHVHDRAERGGGGAAAGCLTERGPPRMRGDLSGGGGSEREQHQAPSAPSPLPTEPCSPLFGTPHATKPPTQGIATARLPIGEYVALSSSSVMCTNHVVEIMIRQQELHDWQAAFEAVIPTRKRKAEDEPAEEGSGVAAAKETEPAAAAHKPAPAADKPVSEDGPEPAGDSAEPVLPAPESSAPVGSQELESTA